MIEYGSKKYKVNESGMDKFLATCRLMGKKNELQVSNLSLFAMLSIQNNILLNFCYSEVLGKNII